MNTIKNIHLLTGILPEAEIEKLEAGAKQHLRFSNITFKIIYPQKIDSRIYFASSAGFKMFNTGS